MGSSFRFVCAGSQHEGTSSVDGCRKSRSLAISDSKACALNAYHCPWNSISIFYGTHLSDTCSDEGSHLEILHI